MSKALRGGGTIVMSTMTGNVCGLWNEITTILPELNESRMKPYE